MPGKTDDLRDIFLDVAEDGTVTERQHEDVSHDPIEDDGIESAVATAVREDGLADAIDGAEPTDGAA